MTFLNALKNTARNGAAAVIVYGITVVSGAAPANAQVPEDVIKRNFYTYQEDPPEYPGIEPGLEINSQNVEQFKDVIAPAMYDFIRRGKRTMTVQETFDFTLHESYIEATRRNDSVRIDSDGNLESYISGRPFPFPPDADDPKSGHKLMWNFATGRVWGDLGCLHPWHWEYRDYETGEVERAITYDRICFKRYAFKTTDDPVPEAVPNPAGLYRGIYLRVAQPQDLRGTQLLVHKYKDDTRSMDAWLYLGFQRRIRRFPMSEITDSFLGSDFMIEDFEGYEGPLSEMDFEYLGSKPLLLPFWDRNLVEKKGQQYTHREEDGSVWEYTDFGGQGNCHTVGPYQLRHAHIVKSTPKDPNHPVGHRIHYIDAQTGELPITEIFDRSGNLWKQFVIGWVHWDKGAHPKNKGVGGMIGDTAAVVDVQSGRCTLAYFRGIIHPDVAPDRWFTPAEMRGN